MPDSLGGFLMLTFSWWPRLVAVVLALGLCLVALQYELTLLGIWTGGYAALVLREAGHALLHALRPSTKAERRLAAAIEHRVAERRLALLEHRSTRSA